MFDMVVVADKKIEPQECFVFYSIISIIKPTLTSMIRIYDCKCVSFKKIYESQDAALTWNGRGIVSVLMRLLVMSVHIRNNNSSFLIHRFIVI